MGTRVQTMPEVRLIQIHESVIECRMRIGSMDKSMDEFMPCATLTVHIVTRGEECILQINEVEDYAWRYQVAETVHHDDFVMAILDAAMEHRPRIGGRLREVIQVVYLYEELLGPSKVGLPRFGKIRTSYNVRDVPGAVWEDGVVHCSMQITRRRQRE